MLTVPVALDAPVAHAATFTQVFQGVVDGVPRYLLPAGAHPAAVHPRLRARLIDYQLVLGGRVRSYRLFVPTRLVGPAPVVVAMNGYTMAGDPESYMHWRALAQRKHFLVLEPFGFDASWNAGRCCGSAARHGVDDRTALTDMLASAAHAYPINRRRVYLVGFSNGGMMAFDYACRFPGAVAAVGVVASAYMSRCRPHRAVPVIHVHGGADHVLPVAGGWSAALHRRVPSLAQTSAPFARLDAAAGTPERTIVVPGAGHVWARIGRQGGFNTTGALLAYMWRYHR